MDSLFIILVFAGIFAIYDALRRINNNILEQTEEIKKFREKMLERNK